ncbi:hypothetical protein TI39_contig408g00012 [Zymoseptoria brevis]|uniref:Uncharacterized protein n=1 Tax=Zymoseptoria brevis TaxID=1047168 RepID=A0A0F4GMQ5_9PEZI|nr:hypothetical protein TI39_contig408g00012 [Zymoseptoria brevis]
MTAAWLESQGIYTKPSPTNNKRLTGTVENMIRVIRRCMERGADTTTLDARGRLVNTLQQWPTAALRAIKDANHRHISTLGFSPVQIKLGMQPEELSDLVEYPATRRQTLIDMLAATAANTAFGWFDTSRTGSTFKQPSDKLTTDPNNSNSSDSESPPSAEVQATTMVRAIQNHTGRTADTNHCFTLSTVNGKQLFGHAHADDMKLFTARTGYLAANQEKLPAPSTLQSKPPKPPKMKDPMQPLSDDNAQDNRFRERAAPEVFSDKTSVILHIGHVLLVGLGDGIEGQKLVEFEDVVAAENTLSLDSVR